MPHALDSSNTSASETQATSTAGKTDDELIASLFDATNESGLNFDFNKPLDQSGKADDAVDYEDISDEDLPDEEGGVAPNGKYASDSAGASFEHPGPEPHAEEQEQGYEDDPDLDDLFGDAESSPAQQKSKPISASLSHTSLPQLHIPTSSQLIASSEASPEDASQLPSAIDEEEDVLDDDDDAELLEQRRLFADSLAHRDLPAPPEDAEELLQSLWPRFDPDEPARFQRLLPPRNAVYGMRKPLKPPKPLQLSKLNLELRQDQEKTFKLTSSMATHRAFPDWTERAGLITINTGKEIDQEEDKQGVQLDTMDDDEIVAGLSIQDLAVLCADWDIASSASESSNVPEMMEVTPEADGRMSSAADSSRKRTSDTLQPSDAEGARKRLKTASTPFDNHMPQSYELFYSLDDPEATNAWLSRRVPLDLNDPQMLIDIRPPETVVTQPRRPGVVFRKDVSGSLTKSMARRYNISNDDAYELLKENHSSKVRSMIGNLTVEHSMPALKLQFPFYKVKLTPREARSYHRPALKVPHDVHRVLKFTKRGSKKRKELRLQTIQQIYEATKDLSVNDNSDIAMCEYSEEQPMVLSDFGMGNKLINYYRRQDEQDNSRPKYELGDTSVLLPQDKSPFSIFGNVAPGEHQPTLHNAMFRAPVWQHKEAPTDFILGRSTTGVNGSEWFIRKTANLFIVGQQLPSVEVPGTHSRKVTDAAKRRLKQISFRVYHKFQANPKRYPALTNDVVREHLPGSDVPQNRGKMREFMEYDKANSMWIPKRDDVIPDTYAGIRERLDAHIRPEDVCLLDAMQVGHQYLKDAGIDKDETIEDGKEGDDEEKEDDTIEEKLAPWNATKNFLKACQGQAMLTLHGPGDPTGRGEAFSFVKTSMKGGFKAVGESIEDRLDKQRLKEYGGHSYNVAKQQKAYEDSINRIWDAQKNSLSADADYDELELEDIDEDVAVPDQYPSGRTPRSEMGTPAATSRRGDFESASQMSRTSIQSQGRRPLRIVRETTNKYGQIVRHEDVIRDPQVMKMYMRRVARRDRGKISLDSAGPTGDAAQDALAEKMLKAELERLYRNKDRRHAREKAKGKHRPSDIIDLGDQREDGEGGAAAGQTGKGASSGGGAGGGVGTTQRKCANCGQVGHIKTNKKLCPLLNGTRQVDTFDDSAFGTGGLGGASAAGDSGGAFDASPSSTGGFPGTPAFSP